MINAFVQFINWLVKTVMELEYSGIVLLTVLGSSFFFQRPLQYLGLSYSIEQQNEFVFCHTIRVIGFFFLRQNLLISKKYYNVYV